MTFYELRRQVAKETLIKYPDMKTRTMARLLNTQYPELFPRVEPARNTIRAFRGALGEAKRKQPMCNSHVR